MTEARQRPQRGLVRLALVYTTLLVSLSGVVWRQSRALDELRAVDALRRQRAVVEAERAALMRRVQELESRHRIVEVAREQLGLHVPRSTEIVILREPGGAAGVPGAGGAGERRAAIRDAEASAARVAAGRGARSDDDGVADGVDDG